MSSDMSRRNFVRTSAGAAVGIAAGLQAVKGAASTPPSDRVRLAVIGTANRGGQLIKATMPHTDAEIVALCDVDSTAMEKWKTELPGSPDTYSDFRKVLERDDIDGIIIATPDHWHAIQTIMACDAGKDVYVEKPLSMTIKEGRHMVNAARRNKRIVQVGVHRRSSQLLRDMRDRIQAGDIGKVTVSSAYRITNMAPNGIGRSTHSEPPAHLDWDMWLGPRAKRPYQDNIAPYKFRWWQQYSSQLGNWGVHYFDAIRWLLDEEAPASVVSIGGTYAVDDDRTIPDTMQTIFELPKGGLLVFGQYEASGMAAIRGEVEIRGTKGVMLYSSRGYEVVPEKGGQFQDPALRMEAEKVPGKDGDLTVQNIRNWLDCIKSRETPWADVEIGHRSTTFCHLGNIAQATRSRIDWDPVNERITNNEEANELLHYEYRSPWTLG